MTKKEALRFLPKKPTSSTIDPARLIWLVIAEPKWGKTKFFMSNPDAVLLAFEEGHKFQRGKKIIIDKWDHKGKYPIRIDSEGCPHMTAMQALQALQLTKLYNMAIIDTVDMAVKMCIDYHVGLVRGASHPTDLGDYGKGWDRAQNTPMRKFLLDIQKTGRGVGMITHTKDEVKKYTSGERARKESTLPSGVMRLAFSQADLVLHGEYGKKRAGNRLRDRILVCEGDADTMAGNRTGALLPERYIVDPDNPWKQLLSFFNNPKAGEIAERKYNASLKKGK